MGHDVVAAIAENNLTKKAKKNLEKLLDGKSIVYYASWMDNIQNSPYWENGMAHQHIFRFDTVEELTTFNETYREILDESTPPNRSPATVTEATADMDQAFFEKNALLAVYVVSSSISYSFYVEKIECNVLLPYVFIPLPILKKKSVTIRSLSSTTTNCDQY